jgi:energy-converting hydrogenase B subunit L
MRNVLRIALEGAFTNFKRIFFAADRVTDMELRRQISTLSVEVDDRVD